MVRFRSTTGRAVGVAVIVFLMVLAYQYLHALPLQGVWGIHSSCNHTHTHTHTHPHTHPHTHTHTSTHTHTHVEDEQLSTNLRNAERESSMQKLNAENAALRAQLRVAKLALADAQIEREGVDRLLEKQTTALEEATLKLAQQGGTDNNAAAAAAVDVAASADFARLVNALNISYMECTANSSASE